MPTYGLLVSGGIDSKCLKHMYPDAIKYHYINSEDVDQSTDSDVTGIDISSYSEKHTGMQAKTVELLDDSDLGLDNIIYGYHTPYTSLSSLPDAPTEGTNDLIKPFENWYKHDIIKYAVDNNIDLRDCVSCLNEKTHAGCGTCYQCQERAMALSILDSEGYNYSSVI